MTTTDAARILADQQEELKNMRDDPRTIERDVFPAYQKLLGSSSLIGVITGPRRAGKSVLAVQLLRDEPFAYINFDDERLAHIEASDLNTLLAAVRETQPTVKTMLLDEIQNVTGWELFVNRLQRLGFRVLVTGSNARLLSRELATHLTGRHVAYELYPFSFREHLRFHRASYDNGVFSTSAAALMKRHLNQYVEQGGFPEVVRGEPIPSYLLSLYSSILTKDIMARHAIRYGKTLRQMAQYLFAHFSRQYSYHKMKNIFSIKSVHTAQNYYAYLEESYLLFSLERWSPKASERLNSPRKVYTIDTGLARALSPRFSRDIGFAYENIVAGELKRRSALDPAIELYYWDAYGQGEVDFAVKRERRIRELIQVCYDFSDHAVREREISALLKARAALRCDALVIITDDTDEQITIDGEKILCLPLWKWLLTPPVT